MDRRGFLKLFGVGAGVAIAAPELLLPEVEPVRRYWQVSRNAPVGSRVLSGTWLAEMHQWQAAVANAEALAINEYRREAVDVIIDEWADIKRRMGASYEQVANNLAAYGKHDLHIGYDPGYGGRSALVIAKVDHGTKAITIERSFTWKRWPEDFAESKA